jgi:hypothetical protein
MMLVMVDMFVVVTADGDGGGGADVIGGGGTGVQHETFLVLQTVVRVSSPALQRVNREGRTAWGQPE